jgi:hypothetical protein
MLGLLGVRSLWDRVIGVGLRVLRPRTSLRRRGRSRMLLRFTRILLSRLCFIGMLNQFVEEREGLIIADLTVITTLFTPLLSLDRKWALEEPSCTAFRAGTSLAMAC